MKLTPKPHLQGSQLRSIGADKSRVKQTSRMECQKDLRLSGMRTDRKKVKEITGMASQRAFILHGMRTDRSRVRQYGRMASLQSITDFHKDQNNPVIVAVQKPAHLAGTFVQRAIAYCLNLGTSMPQNPATTQRIVSPGASCVRLNSAQKLLR